MTSEALKAKTEDIMNNAVFNNEEEALMFKTTFERYVNLIELLERLFITIDKEGVVITKEYVKGRLNLCVNPSVKEYNSVSLTANKTALLLMEMYSKSKAKEEDDPLLRILNQ